MKKVFKIFFRFVYSLPFGLRFTKRVILSDLEKTLLDFQKAGFFLWSGWIQSWNLKRPQNQDGEPQPWFTYGANRFIEARLKNDFSVFEYGSGNSTLFFGPRVKKVVSVEHNPKWFADSDPKPFDNVEINLFELDDNDGYPSFLTNLNEEFDLIVVDGRQRVSCVKHSISCLSERGVLVLDDSERPKYSEAHKIMKQAGFRKIDFFGISLGDYGMKSTTFFYREGNCLKI